MQAVNILVFLALGATVSGSPNVPIWEQLTHQEKMGRLMYVFTYLVDNYCKGSTIPDCNKVLTLYGMSNLLNEDDNALNRMDPYQHNSKVIIWEKIMRGDFKIPLSKSFYSNSIAEEVRAEDDYDYINEVHDSPSSYQVNQRINKLSNDPHPFAVRVPAPAKIVAAHTASMTGSNLVTSDFDVVEDSMIKNNDIPAEVAASNSPKSSIDIAKDNSDIAVGSSHPYAVKVLPESTMPELIPVEIKSTRASDPMVTESHVQEGHNLPPTLLILKGK